MNTLSTIITEVDEFLTGDDGPDYSSIDKEYEKYDLSGDLNSIVPLEDHYNAIMQDAEAIKETENILRILRFFHRKAVLLGDKTYSNYSISISIRMQRMVQLVLSQIKAEALKYGHRDVVTMVVKCQQDDCK